MIKESKNNEKNLTIKEKDKYENDIFEIEKINKLNSNLIKPEDEIKNENVEEGINNQEIKFKKTMNNEQMKLKDKNINIKEKDNINQIKENNKIDDNKKNHIKPINSKNSEDFIKEIPVNIKNSDKFKESKNIDNKKNINSLKINNLEDEKYNKSLGKNTSINMISPIIDSKQIEINSISFPNSNISEKESKENIIQSKNKINKENNDINKPDIKYKNKHDFNNTEKVKIIDKKNKKLCFPNKDSRSQIFDVNKFHDNFKDIELKLSEYYPKNINLKKENQNINNLIPENILENESRLKNNNKSSSNNNINVNNLSNNLVPDSKENFKIKGKKELKKNNEIDNLNSINDSDNKYIKNKHNENIEKVINKKIILSENRDIYKLNNGENNEISKDISLNKVKNNLEMCIEKNPIIKDKIKDSLINSMNNNLTNETSDIKNSENLLKNRNNIISQNPSNFIIGKELFKNDNVIINNNNFIVEPSNTKIKTSLLKKDLNTENNKNEKIITIKNFDKNIEINEQIIRYLKFIIKNKKRRIIIFNPIKKENENINDKNKKINAISLKSYLKILKMISRKEKEEKYILIQKYNKYIILLKNYFNNLKNEKNNNIILSGGNIVKININYNNNNNINKKEIIILIKKLIEKIIVIKNIYIYLLINNNKNSFNQQIKIKSEENIEKIKKEIEDIKNKLIRYLLKINFEDKEELIKYLKLIIVELEKVDFIKEDDIANIKNINDMKRRRIHLWLLILPLFYIVYFLYTNAKI